MDAAIVLARIVQYLGGAVLFGTPLFLVYALPSAGSAADDAARWARPVAAWSATGLIVGAVAWLLAQTALMAGDPAAAGDPEMLAGVLTESAMGFAVIARVAAGALAVVGALTLRRGRGLWI